MEKQYSVQFFTSFLETLQNVCQQYLNYSQFVEVSGYVCVEIDNMKKERYVLSELLQSSGNVVSESYCTKSFKTSRSGGMVGPSWKSEGSKLIRDRNKENSWMDHSQSREVTAKHGRNNDRYRQCQVQDRLNIQTSIDDSQTVQQSSVIPNIYHKQQLQLVHNQRPSNFRGSSASPQTEPSVQREQITLPQPQYPTPSASVSAATSTSSGTTAIPQEDEVIDLDLFEDDLDLPMEEEEDERGQDQSEHGEGQGQIISGELIPPQEWPFAGGCSGRKSTVSPATLCTLKYTLKQFSRFHFERSGQNIDLFSTPPAKLNQLLLEFFRDAKKVAGGELRPRSLKNVQSCLDKYLRDGGYPYKITKDKEFQTSRDFLKRKISELNDSLTYSKIDDSDIETLFQSGQLGLHNSDSILNAMWFLNSKYFACQRPSDHFNIKWGDVRLNVDDQGREFLERPFTDSFSLKMFARPEFRDRCFVTTYKHYRDMRPKLTLDDDYAFYLKPNGGQHPSQDSFLPEPLPLQMLGSMWKKLVYGAGLSHNKRI